MRSVLIVILSLTLFASCRVGPRYHAPKEATARFVLPTASWRHLPKELTQLTDEAEIDLCSYHSARLCQELTDWKIEPWWTKFNDPVLHLVMLEALNHNVEYQAYESRQRARAADVLASSAELWPSLIPYFQASETKASAANAPGIPASALKNGFFSTGIQTTWEIDLFGRLRSQANTDTALEEAAQLALHEFIRLTLAEVARDYLQLRNLQANYQLQSQIVALEKKRRTINKVFFEAGKITEADFLQSRSGLYDQRTQTLQLHQDILAMQNLLNLLTGYPPDSLPWISSQSSNALRYIRYKGPLLASTPTLLLLSRPDVVKAEAELRAATASIGVAVADFYPRVDLESNLGYSVVSLADVGKSLGEVYSLIPRMRWVFYESHRVRSAVNRAKANTREKLALFKNSLLTALNEASTNVHNLATAKRQLTQSLAKQSAWRRHYRNTRLQHQVGSVDQLTLIDAHQSYLQASLAANNARTVYNQAIVTLIQALGGGWRRKDA